MVYSVRVSLAQADKLNELTTEVFIRIISGFTSPFEAVRVVTVDTIDKLYELLDQSSEYSKVFRSILNEKDKLVMNSEELSLFWHNTKHKRAQLFEFIEQPNSSMVLKASLLNMLKLVDENDTKYLKIAVDVALDILKRIGDYSQRITLNPHESTVVYHAIIRFNPGTISSISSPGSCRTFFEMMLQQSNIFLDIDDTEESISVKAMNLNMFNDFNRFNINRFNVSEQKFIIESIVKCATFANFIEVRKRAGKFFQKSIELDGKIELDILTKMATLTSSDSTKKEQAKCLSQELLQTPEWKCGVTLLEFLSKKRLENPLGLIRQLFPVLRKCLAFDDQSMVEYTKQLLLIDILNCCKLMSPTRSFQETDFKVDLIVQCVRGTQNPQTHHHALQLLAKLATMIPESVLHEIMEIFTFVGCVVVRRDDDYIYQLISDVIKSVVPILKQNNIIQVLRAFSIIILDVPMHRRLALYEDLLKTLDPQEYLWVFLAILFEKDARDKDSPITDLQKKIKSAIEITNLFDCHIILQTCYRLIKFVKSQLNTIDKGTEQTAVSKSIFNAELYGSSKAVRYIYLILNFVNVLTKDRSEFSMKMASLEQQSLLKHKETFKNIIPIILTYIKDSSKSTIRKGDISWSDGFRACYHILDNLLALLYPEMLLRVVDALLSEENEVEVRQQIIDLLNKKLHSPELFVDCKDSILSLLAPLTKIVNSITETTTISKLQQYSLVSVQLLSRIVAKDYPNEFGDLLKTLSKILQSDKELSVSLWVIECLGELCANLRVECLSHLYRFMPAIMGVLDDLLTRQKDVISVVYEIILKAIYRIVETVPLFLSPYLVNLITSLSILWSRLQVSSSNDSQKNLLKLDEIWQKLSSSLELRVLIPMVEKHIYPDLLNQGKFNATGPLMILLLDSFGHSEQADLVQNCQDLTTFFIGVMDFRSKFHSQCATVDVQEDFFIKTLIGFILKLSEGTFRPFYNKLHEWSNENAKHSFDRSITFYRLSNKIAESLKSLFITFATPIIQNSADLLKKDFTEAEIRASSAPPATLIHNILLTLQTIFLHSNSFINSQRFNVLMEPLVNVLDHEEYVTDANINKLLPKCFAQFAVAANNDLLWKQLNHQILMKTRSKSGVGEFGTRSKKDIFKINFSQSCTRKFNAKKYLLALLST